MAHAQFQIALKTLIEKDGKILTLRTNDNYLDFPGGRIDETEIEMGHEETLQREISEELGDGVAVKVGKLALISQRSYTVEGVKNYVLAVFYIAQLESGEVNLSDEHKHFEWLEPNQILQTDAKFMSPDEEKQLINYFR